MKEKAALKKFRDIHRKTHLCLLKRDLLVKTRLQHGCFPVYIAKYFRQPTLKNSYKRLLLCLTQGSHLWVPP